MTKIYVDGQELEVKAGDNLLEACLGAGLDLPYFCWHPAMGSIGSCRQCAVVQYQDENDQRGRLVMGCMTMVAEGAHYSLQTETAVDFRKAVIESLMVDHPHDCPVCGEGGECHLQDMTVMSGHRTRRFRGRKNTYRNQYLGPLIQHEMNRCIACYRCVRFYNDYAGGTDLSAQASHDHVFFGRHQDGVLENEFSGNLVEVCPTGVFTDKPLVKSFTRKWDLQSAPSLCTGCAVGCNTAPGERYGKLKRVHNRYNHEVNGYFLCDRGRFGSGYVNHDTHLKFAGLRKADGTFEPIHQSRAVEWAKEWIQDRRVAAIGSPRASLEANWLLKELVGADNFAMGFSDREAAVNRQILASLQSSTVMTPSIRQMESADAILVLGEDVTNTAPRVALGLRQAARNKARELGVKAGFTDWQDAAVRNLAQDSRSPLIIVSPLDTRLDDVASHLITRSIQDVAVFANSLVEAIRGNPCQDSQAAEVAKLLAAARKPLVISGSGLLSTEIIDSALAVAESLQRDNAEPMLSYCLQEANALGLTMLGGQTLSSLVSRNDEIDTLLILENDLKRRLSPDQFEQLFNRNKKIIGMDVLENSTLDNCDLVLPAATFAESEGTMVSSEGRAQRYYPVFAPQDEILPSWCWALEIGHELLHPALKPLHHFDDVVSGCAASNVLLAGIGEAAPDRGYRYQGLKIPRQTHRYSGRTAMNANVSVHEPQQKQDTETPLAFSMEGTVKGNSAFPMPYSWSPGWNSNQSIFKFQQEIDGNLRGGQVGVRLIEPATPAPEATPSVGSTNGENTEPDSWQLVPVYRVHGSDELSGYTAEIAELAGPAFIAISGDSASKLGVTDGDGLCVESNGNSLSLEVRVIKRAAPNCIGFSAGFNETLSLLPGSRIRLKKDDSWQRRQPQMIASDRGGNNG